MAAAALAASLSLTFCWVFTPSSRLLVMATALVPFALPGYAVAAGATAALGALSTGRRRLVATSALGIAVVGLALHAALLGPAYLGSHASGRPDLTVMTSNLRLGLGDTAEVVRLAEDESVDLVVMQEVTPEAAPELLAMRTALPYVAGRTAPGAFGTVVFSRYPLTQVSQLRVTKGAWQMRVAAPTPFWLVAVHTSQPYSGFASWRPDHDALHAAVARLRGPTVVAGDLNATLDHGPVRRLLGLGLSDAARVSNAGWQPTWPVDVQSGRRMPFGLGLMTLDHILTSADFSAVSTSTHPVPGSDHRTLVAGLVYR